MGLHDRNRNKHEKRHTRKKKRDKLTKKGLDPDKFYHGAFYIGHVSTVKEA